MYKTTALAIFHVLVLLILLNLIAYPFFYAKDSPEGWVHRFYRQNEIQLKKVYSGISEQDIQTLLQETWSRPFVYQPFTQFTERPFAGRYVNVDPHGFRVSKDQGPWPPDERNLNVFVFGGSTVFNYGVSDEQTVASHLQGFLSSTELKRGVRVYNFGQGHYFSSQELILFQILLRDGHVPDMAFFFDGLNEFYHHDGKPAYTDRISELVQGFSREGLPVSEFGLLWESIPLIRAMGFVKRKLLEKTYGHKGDTIDEMKYNDPEVLRQVMDRYISNKRSIEAIAGAFGVKPVFVWQPVPTYKYDLRFHLFASGGFGDHTYSKFGYPLMEDYIKVNPQGPNFLWCADIQQGIQEPLYVDPTHYSAKMSRMLAEAIFRFTLVRNLLPVQ